MIEFAPHERLLPHWFFCRFPRALGEMAPPDELQAWLKKQAPAPLHPSEEVRAATRSLLRWGGFKPSGRSKPASEFLEKAHQEGILGSINLAVDACNVVSLHSGLPISVVDAELALAPYRVEVVQDKVSYVFNPSGQELDLKGLVCLWDAQGPCGSPVKDSQRTKTHAGTTDTLCLIWGSQEVAAQVEAAGRWYRELLTQLGGHIREE